MPKQDPGPSVKDDETYEALRDRGESKEKARKVGIEGRSNMSKDELIDALRNH
ncbi:MAG: hypothetical protein WD342_04590 [Verrucomicrobiales bacterium]